MSRTETLAETLRRFRDHLHPKPESHALVFVYPASSRSAGDRSSGPRERTSFERISRKAGIGREALFVNNGVRRQIRVHDLRATFVTVAIALGKSKTWVSDRTGHRSSQQIKNYRRQATTQAELKLGDLAPLCDAIPELREVGPSRAGRSSGTPTKDTAPPIAPTEMGATFG